MDIDIKNYPVAILFSGNIFDFRALQFFTALNKQRIHQLIPGSTFNLIKLDANEKNLLCIEKDGKFYLKYSFLKFISDSGEYFRQFNNIRDTSDPVFKEIFYFMRKYSDKTERSKDLNLLLELGLNIIGDELELDSITNFSIDINEITNLISFDITDISGYENENNILKDFNFKNMFNYAGINIDSHNIFVGLYQLGLNLINNQKYKSKFDDGTTSDVFNINIPEKFNIKSKKANYFSGNFDIIGNGFKLGDLILNRYNFLNLIDFGDIVKFKKDAPYNYWIEKEKFFWEVIFKKDIFLGFKSARQIESLVKITKHGDKYTINIDQLEEIKILEKSIDILKNFNETGEAIKVIKQYLSILDNKISDKYYDTTLKGDFTDLNTHLENIDELNLKDHEKFNENIDDLILKLKTKFITNLSMFKDSDRIIISYNDKNFNVNNLNFKDNTITFSSNDIPDDMLNINIILILNFIKINSNKCFGLGLNLKNKDCSEIIPEIILEKGYGDITQEFFRNDNNFKIYELMYFCKYQFNPDPNLILLLLNKLQFKKKIIKIYDTKLVIIQDYNSWKSNQKIDINLNNNKYLGIYLEICILYINLNLYILNPKYKNFQHLIEIIGIRTHDKDFKLKKQILKIENDRVIVERVFKKFFIKCRTDISKNYKPLMKGGSIKEDYDKNLVKKLLLYSKKIIKDDPKMRLLYSKYEIINKLKILNNS